MPNSIGHPSQGAPTQRNFTRIIIVLLVCIIVALFTWRIWQGDYFIQLLISLGYGISALAFRAILVRLFPQFHRVGVALLSILCTLFFGSINAAYWIFGGWDWQLLPQLFPALLLALTVTAVLTFGFYFFEQKFRMQQELAVAKWQQAEQQQALLLSELKQLQSQIEPHFLFNTLANLNALIALDPPQAQQLLNRLTALLRRTLNTSRQTIGKLSDEIALLDDYLAIQQIRLGTRLRYQIKLADNCRQLPFVPMLLQPLVENAVVHGIEPMSNGGEVTVTVSCQDEQLHLSIEDSGVGLTHSPTTARPGNGIALNNIHQRLASLFGSEATLSLQPRIPQGTTASITIPLQKITSLGDKVHA